MINNYPKGSEWRKWDLHIHSDASDGKMTCEDIVNKVKELGINVIALTDHHTATNIDKMKTVCEQNGISLIPGIEFRTDKGKHSVHLIGLFPWRFKNYNINSKFLHETILSGLGLSETQIITRGKENLNKNGKLDKDISEETAFKEGMFLEQKNLENICDKIHEYGGIVVIHAGDKNNSLEKEMSHEGKPDVKPDNNLGPLKEEFFTKGYIDICEVSNNSERKFYFTKFNRASIMASDAHEIKEIGRKFVWIKADPTFEGLRQIMDEPNSRVVFQEHEPDTKLSHQIIDKVRYKTNDNTFSNDWIELNPNLNSIIGGKSSGKSLILHYIAKSIDRNRVLDLFDEYEFSDYEFENEIKGMDFEVLWKDSEISSLRNSAANSTKQITYLPQTYINRIAENKKDKNEFSNILLDILKQNETFKSYYEIILGNIQNENNILSKRIVDLFSLKRKIVDINTEIKKIGDKNGIEKTIKEIKEKNDRIRSNSGLSETENKTYSSKQDEIENIDQSIEMFDNRKISFGEFVKKAKKLPQYLSETFEELIIEEILILLSEDDGDGEKEINKVKNDIIKSVKVLIEDKVKTIFDFKLIDDKVKELKEKKTKILASLKPYDDRLKNLKLLTDNENKIREQEKILKRIETKTRECDSVNKKYLTAINDIKVFYKNVFEYYRGIIEELTKEEYKVNTQNILMKIDLSFNVDKFDTNFTDYIFDRRNSLNSEFKDSFNKSSIYMFRGSKHLERIYQIFDLLLREPIDKDWITKNIRIKTSANIEDSINKLFTDYFDINYKITYNGDDLVKMSPGKKGLVILQLILHLSNSTHPILIDQPEENIDVRTITDELVNFLKEKKINRQIIMVTHNANLVVLADSEEVIVANQDGQDPGRDNEKSKFEYVSGSLENTFINTKGKYVLQRKGIREHVCEILEGGEEAFKQRERKYHI